MNYRLIIMQPVEAGADLTTGVIESDRSKACRFGVCELDSHNRIVGWEEKPVNPEPTPHNPPKCFVSMGIHCFNRDFLVRLLRSGAKIRPPVTISEGT